MTHRCRHCKRLIPKDALSTQPVFAWHMDAAMKKQCVGTHAPIRKSRIQREAK